METAAIMRMKELVQKLDRAAKAYYQQDTEIISNREYDQMYDELQALEKETGTVLANSPTISVGYEAVDQLPKEEHESPMLSLDKTKDREVLREFIGEHKTLLSWKLDGLTIVLTYENGGLAKAVTRGNGVTGEVVTNNARVFKNIPLKISFKGRLVLRGEAIITYSDFEKINEELRQYSPDLAARPMIVAANKADLLSPDSDNLDRLKAHVEAQGYEFYVISAATTQGTRELMKTIAGKLAALPPVTIYEPEYVKPLAEAGDADELQIEHYDDLWVVSGKWLQKLLNDINFDDYESRMYFDRQLRNSGLFDRLEEQGIEDGDTVSIYDFEFDYTK